MQRTHGGISGRAFRHVAKAAVVSSLLVSAGVMAAAIATPSHPWLGWFPLLPVFVVVRVARPRQALGCGAFWGASLFAFSVLAVDSAIEPTIKSAALLVTVPSAYLWACALVTRRFRWCVLFMGVTWIGVELAMRPLGLPHGLLASTQGNGPVVQLVGGLLGSAFVGFLVALGNALILSLLGRLRFRGYRWPSLTAPLDVSVVWVRSQASSRLSSRPRLSGRPRAPPPFGHRPTFVTLRSVP